ncbi:MAG: hypothetical protein RRA35_07565 [Desulfomonilia bacterium]|nr:hypothetical protein [Desulfomonilia bacterium]
MTGHASRAAENPGTSPRCPSSLFTGTLVILLLVFLWAAPARALVSIEHDGITLTYPRGEEAIAHRVITAAPVIRDFLASRGFSVTLPLEIVLDDTLDVPRVFAHMIPHREIRIPLRAPGVPEEGFLEEDPWVYFLFMGLCRQGIYALRGGIPEAAHTLFGEVISPNLVNPPWVIDGVGHLLYTSYRGQRREHPLDEAYLASGVPRDMARVSNHPGIWPGHFGYRIYGRPFIGFLHERFGWEGIHAFLLSQGSGIIPLEIDFKARATFGSTWTTLWDEFITVSGLSPATDDGTLISGYVTGPIVFWDNSGVFPGPKLVRHRGRYGYRDERGVLWLSEYDADGVSQLVGYTRQGLAFSCDTEHLWDPGQGNVAVTRFGSTPALIIFQMERTLLGRHCLSSTTIPAPPGALQLSGPVMNEAGHIAVSV